LEKNKFYYYFSLFNKKRIEKIISRTGNLNLLIIKKEKN